MLRTFVGVTWNYFGKEISKNLIAFPKASCLNGIPIKVCTSLFKRPATSLTLHGCAKNTQFSLNETIRSLNFLASRESCLIPKRDLTKFSIKKGKRKSVKAVLKRFYRLNWGIWVRGRCGRQKKLYRKSANRKRRLRQHVFTNASQSFLLDKMVTNFWRKPKYYVDDPYEPYHSREEFPYTRKKPVPSN